MNESSATSRTSLQRRPASTTIDRQQQPVSSKSSNTSRKACSSRNSDSSTTISGENLSPTLGEKCSTNTSGSSRKLGQRPNKKSKRVNFENNNGLLENENDVNSYKYLVGRIHRDDEDFQRYVTEKVYVDRRSKDILAERTLLLKDGRKHKALDPSPIHIKDIVNMTNSYDSEIASSNTKVLLSQLMQSSEQVERMSSSEYCLSGEMQNTQELGPERKQETMSMVLLAIARGDQLMEYCLQANITLTDIVPVLTPTTRKQAMKSPQKDLWIQAEKKEIESIQRKKVLLPAKLPRGKKLLRTKWVYRVKYGAGGELKSYKARLVACGYAQIFGVDFDETYSPVIRLTSLRLLFAISAQLGLIIHQMDVDTAFLHADITEEIYINPPDGMVLPDNMDCFRLKKALYGLKQSPREWYNIMNAFLLSIHFKRLYGESCLYYREDDDDNTICIISLYVDDILIAGNSLAIVQRVKNQLNANYDMKDLGVVAHILGCEVQHDVHSGETYLTQYQYTKKAIEKFFGPDLKPSDTPADSTVILSRNMSPTTEEEKAEMSKIPYREAVGTLLWLSLGTRPDISYAVSQVARYNDCYGMEHWQAVKRIFRYLKGTINLGLRYSSMQHSAEFTDHFQSLGYLNNGEAVIYNSLHQRTIRDKDVCVVTGLVDSNLARCIDTRRSVTGYIFLLGCCIVSWQSKQQTSVALSSMEAENMAACAATQEALWLSRLLKEFGCQFTKPVTLLEDNQACIYYSKNPGDFQRTKHIDQKYHFVREQVAEGNVILQKIKTTDNLADIFTKPLNKREFFNLIQYFMFPVNQPDSVIS